MKWNTYNWIPGAQDGELRKMFQRTLTKQGLKFKLSTKVVSGEVSDSGVKLTLEPSKGGDQEHMDADVVLVSAGDRAERTWCRDFVRVLIQLSTGVERRIFGCLWLHRWVARMCPLVRAFNLLELAARGEVVALTLSFRCATLTHVDVSCRAKAVHRRAGARRHRRQAGQAETH